MDLLNFSIFRRNRCFHLPFPGLLGLYLDPVTILHILWTRTGNVWPITVKASPILNKKRFLIKWISPSRIRTYDQSVNSRPLYHWATEEKRRVRSHRHSRLLFFRLTHDKCMNYMINSIRFFRNSWNFVYTPVSYTHLTLPTIYSV